MLDFPCPSCGRRFSLADDEAGRDLQCPDCGILVSVPLASDLAGLEADGTIKVADAVVPPAAPRRFDELWRTYSRSRVDADGNEIDNRTHVDQIELAPLPAPAADARPAPRYDPESGELVRPLAVAPPIPAPVLPAGPDAFLPGRRPISYRPKGAAAPAEGAPRRVPANEVWVELFRPMNVAVMGMVFVGHFMLNVSFLVVNAGLLFFFIAPIVMFMLLLGHYGNVVDEVATEDADELPRPLRTLSWHDDLWGPARDVFFTVMLVVSPFIAAAYFRAALGGFVGAAVALAGVASLALLLLVPVVLLTLRTSGSLANLRPDRVVGTVRACGVDYVPVALLGLAAVPTLAVGFVASMYWWIVEMGSTPLGDWGVLNSFPVAHLVLVVGIYLGHLFAWRVGLLYRLHQPTFPWVNQEAIRGDAKKAKPVRRTPEERNAIREAKRDALRDGRRA